MRDRKSLSPRRPSIFGPSSSPASSDPRCCQWGVGGMLSQSPPSPSGLSNDVACLSLMGSKLCAIEQRTTMQRIGYRLPDAEDRRTCSDMYHD